MQNRMVDSVKNEGIGQSSRFSADSVVAGANKSHKEIIVIVTKEALIREQVWTFMKLFRIKV